MRFGKGETRHFRQRLQKGTTDTGNLSIFCYRNHFEVAKLSRNQPRKLCYLLAIVQEIAYDPYWLNNNEVYFNNEFSKMKLIRNVRVDYKR